MPTLWKTPFKLLKNYYVLLLLFVITFPFTLSWLPRTLFLLPTRLNQLSVAVEPRLTQWDWKDTREEVFCRKPHYNSSEPIPNIVHYILLADEDDAEISFPFYLSMRATLARLLPHEVKLHTYGINKDNQWWRLIKHRITLVVHDRYSLHGPHNQPVDDFGLAHQSDFLRLSVLESEGGIYLDGDMYPLKSFEELLWNPRDIVMGHEGGNRYGLCNAVIIAHKRSKFLKLWRDTYTSFNEKDWNYHSVLMPKMLQKLHSKLICPLSPTVFFWPTWATEHRQYMYDPISTSEAAELRRNMTAFGGVMYENQLAIHQAPANLTVEKMKDTTRFTILLNEVMKEPI